MGHVSSVALLPSSLAGENAEDEREELVDVGAGHGAVLKQIVEKHPDLDPRKVILQDRKNMVQMTKISEWLPEGLVLMEHDFMTEQPNPFLNRSVRVHGDDHARLRGYCMHSFTFPKQWR